MSSSSHKGNWLMVSKRVLFHRTACDTFRTQNNTNILTEGNGGNVDDNLPMINFTCVGWLNYSVDMLVI